MFKNSWHDEEHIHITCMNTIVMHFRKKNIIYKEIKINKKYIMNFYIYFEKIWVLSCKDYCSRESIQHSICQFLKSIKLLKQINNGDRLNFYDQRSEVLSNTSFVRYYFSIIFAVKLCFIIIVGFDSASPLKSGSR